MRRVPVGKILLIAGLCFLIPLLLNVVASFFTARTDQASWLISPALGLVAALTTALIQAYGSAPPPVPQPAGGYPGDVPHPDASQRRGLPLGLVLIIALLVIGVGGFAVAEGVRYGIGYVTGNEPGTDRLRRPASESANGVKVTVESVTYTKHFTRVGIAVRNESESSLSLPVFGYCIFSGSDGTTLQADAFRSRWSETLPPGGLQRGTVTFKGHLPDSVRRAAFSFTQIFGPGGGSITVKDIRLKRPR
jgi:hypothetical protein